MLQFPSLTGFELNEDCENPLVSLWSFFFMEPSPLLKRVRLDLGIPVTDDMLIKVTWQCHNVVELQFGGCESDIGDKGFKAVGNNCTGLQVLVLDAPGVTDEGFKFLVQHCIQLQNLGFRGKQPKRITDASIEALAQHCTNLQRLRFDETPDLKGSYPFLKR